MAADVDAVIAALRVALEEAQQSPEDFWKVKAANRWIAQLPGAWTGRWRRLKLKSSNGVVGREEFVGHVRAAIAFLEAHRNATGPQRKWWPVRRRNAQKAAAQAPAQHAAPREHSNLLKARKPMPGVH